ALRNEWQMHFIPPSSAGLVLQFFMAAVSGCSSLNKLIRRCGRYKADEGNAAPLLLLKEKELEDEVHSFQKLSTFIM
ncbi:MAG TPA: hypothetical protein PL045_12075, partial [Chitinophagaceae bacterium]|nr:hypothetical protein [Chitinophagaceae bacterium]